MKKRNVLTITSILLLSCNLPSFSKDILNKEEIENLTLEQLLDTEIVFAASKKEQKTSKSPANTIIVSEDEIRQRGYSNLKDVLADLPGMETIDFHFSEVGTLVPVRGVSGNNKIIVLINGMKINPPARENMMFRNDQSVRYAKRVEIIYGPGSALYGSDAVSAVINIVTKTSEDYKEQDKTASALLKGGMNNTVDGSLGLNLNINENSSLTGYAQYYNSNGTDYSSNYPDYFKGYKESFNKSKPNEPEYTRWDQGLNGFISLQTGNTSIQYYHRNSSRSSSQGLLASFPFSNQAIWKDSSNVLRAENILKIKDNLTATTSFTYNKYEIDPSSAYVWLLNDKYNYNDDKYGRGRGLEFEERFAWDILKDNDLGNGFSKNLSLTGGIWLADYESTPKATIAGGYNPKENLISQGTDFTYFNSKDDRDNNKDVKVVSPITQLSYQNYATYLQADWDILDNLTAVVGARVDLDSRFNSTPFNPRASLIYTPIDNLTLKLIYGRAFVFPPPYFTHAVFQNPVQINQPNANMKPEQAQSTELNVTYAIGNFSINTSGYYNTQSDLFLLGDGAPAATVIKDEIWVSGNDKSIKLTNNTNNGQSRMMGIDSLIKYRITNNHSLFLSTSYVNGEFDILGKTSGLDRISNANVRLGGNFKIIDKLFVSPRISWRSNPNFLPDQAPHLKNELTNLYQVDLYSYYDLNNFRLFVNLNNITNNKYALHGGYAPVPAETFYGVAGVDYSF
jgi:outer membrane receptor protein involved in Fe transport